MKKYRLGIVLSGGGARGLGHLGALEAFEEYGLQPDIISGVSAGAIAGAMYAAGMRPIDIFSRLKAKKVLELSRFHLPKNGLLKLSGLRKELEAIPLPDTFDQLTIPLSVAATNLNLGRIEYLNQGNLTDAVVASASIPILFAAQKIGPHWYVDGGVFDNLPARPLRENTHRIIGVHVNHLEPTNEVNKLGQIAQRVFQLTVSATLPQSMALCDAVVQPKHLQQYSILDSSTADIFFDTTYKETKKVLDSLGPKWFRRRLWPKG